jgi:hypothetical protein
MNWRNLVHRVKPSPKRLDADLEEELAFHLDMKQREYERDGLTREDALAAARRSLGNRTLVHEDARDAWRFTWLSDMAQDLRYGTRTLAAQPGFALAAILALTVGIGINGILFSVYNALALAPWAVREPSTLAQVCAERGREGRWMGISWPEFRYIRENSQSASDMAAWDVVRLRITYGESAWKANGVAASENFFDMFGTGFVQGRGFSAGAADIVHPAPELILQHDVWRSRFGGDPAIVGKSINVNGHLFEVVGVAAAGFSGPAPIFPDAWLPAPWLDIFNPDLHMVDNANSCCAQVMVRLKPGASRESAAAELTAISSHFEPASHGEPHRFLLTRPSFLVESSGPKAMKSGFAILFGAALLILLLACANVAKALKTVFINSACA